VPDEINEIFDTISYQKGGSVIRMMANFLQLSTFNQGTVRIKSFLFL
jgi:aminopeptidase N